MMSIDEFQELTYRWEFVLTAAALYVAVVKHFNRSRPCAPASFSKTTAFKYFCVVHNLALAVYSGWTFLKAVPIVAHQFGRSDLPLVQRICSADEAIFRAGLDKLAWYFYLSKYYEVIDTAIILVKGKKSPLLQTYHHAGAMISMFAGAKYSATPIFLFVLFNSFIHTIMYMYYTTTTLKLPFPRTLKKSLTSLQIMQFLVGGSSAASYFFLQPEDGSACLPTGDSQLATAITLAYLAPLTTLFMQFFVREYKRKPVQAAVQRAEKAVNSSLKARA